MSKLRSFEKENFMASFAAQLKSARKALELSQCELAQEIRVSPSSVRQWEAEENLPGLLAYRRAREVIKRARMVRVNERKVNA